MHNESDSAPISDEIWRRVKCLERQRILFSGQFSTHLKATPLEGRPGSLEALYVAHFGDVDSPAMWNGGVVVLETQRVFGGDSGYYYTGSFELSGQTFRAAATVQRHHSWWRSAWGDQTPRFEIEVTATRRADGAMIEGTMRRHDLPGIQLPLKLIRMTDLP